MTKITSTMIRASSFGLSTRRRGPLVQMRVAKETEKNSGIVPILLLQEEQEVQHQLLLRCPLLLRLLLQCLLQCLLLQHLLHRLNQSQSQNQSQFRLAARLSTIKSMETMTVYLRQPSSPFGVKPEKWLQRLAKMMKISRTRLAILAQTGMGTVSPNYSTTPQIIHRRMFSASYTIALRHVMRPVKKDLYWKAILRSFSFAEAS